MAKTNLRDFTVQEKLNKMDVDVISVDVAVQSSQSLDLMYEPTEIPNAFWASEDTNCDVDRNEAIPESAVITTDGPII